ncbi:MAG: DinB family protein [Bacteroidetes bacterium]|nr:DinB family protein [Bacteroidota bacterium]
MDNQNSNHTERIVTQVKNAWAAQNKNVTAFFNKYEDEAYLKEIAPDKNRAVYLLGHLTAVNDNLLPLFGLGEKLYPELEEIFLKSADKAIAHIPTVADLKQKWETVNTTLSNHFDKMTADEWLDRHTAVSAEDFKLEPTRNKLNVLIGRTIHQSYHAGQLNLLDA